MPASLVILLAQAQPPAPGADRGEEFGKTSPIALVVILLLGIATFLLIRSMTKRLRNVPESFDPPGEAERSGARPSAGETERSGARPAAGETGDGPGDGPDDGPGSRGASDPSSGVDSPSPGGRTNPGG